MGRELEACLKEESLLAGVQCEGGAGSRGEMSQKVRRVQFLKGFPCLTVWILSLNNGFKAQSKSDQICFAMAVLNVE